ncbi:MAG TPA: VOC family protein [Candidatus Paceibacterota bacterium]|nr:VOC family protein [Candidatus Paceibacterota bacterium]
MQKITPFIWIKDNAREALDFYTKLFADSAVVSITPIEGAPGPAGQFVAQFTLQGAPFMLIQGGDNEILRTPGPLSLTVPCDTQEEIDALWSAFEEGGKPIACGWITDRFGVTWQVMPAKMGELMSGDPEKVKRVTAAMLKMMKFDIAALEAAAQG